jgi:hypothetical protein
VNEVDRNRRRIATISRNNSSIVLEVYVDLPLNIPPIIFAAPVFSKAFHGILGGTFVGPVWKKAIGRAIVADFAEDKIEESLVDLDIESLGAVGPWEVEIEFCYIQMYNSFL